MRFSTFSTGFSTIKIALPYTRRNGTAVFMVTFGQKSQHSAFYKKESRRFFFVFYKGAWHALFVFSNLECWVQSFQHQPIPHCVPWKIRGKRQFSTAFFSPQPSAKSRTISCVFAGTVLQRNAKNPLPSGSGSESFL